MIKDRKPIINNTTNITQNNIQININDYGKGHISYIIWFCNKINREYGYKIIN